MFNGKCNMRTPVTLLCSNPNVTTCDLLKKFKHNGWKYELRYYRQIDKLELVIHKSHEYDEFVIQPESVCYDHIHILEKLKFDNVPKNIILELEKFIFQHITGDVECQNAKD